MSNHVTFRDDAVKTNAEYSKLPSDDTSSSGATAGKSKFRATEVKNKIQNLYQISISPKSSPRRSPRHSPRDDKSKDDATSEFYKQYYAHADNESPKNDTAKTKVRGERVPIAEPSSSGNGELDLNGTVDGHYPAARDMWSFVDSAWFPFTVAMTFVVSVVMIVIELNNSEMAAQLNVPNLCISGLLVLELWAKWSHYGRQILCAHWSFVLWNVFDIFLVAASLADNLLTFRPEDGPFGSKALILLRFVRLSQIVKILNIVLDYDLSWSDVPWFQSFIGCVIGFNSLLMGFETDMESVFWSPIEQCLLTIYTGELLVRMKKQGVFKFISYENHDFVWNWLDLIIVVSSAADSWGCGMLKLLAHALEDDAEGSGDESKKKGGLKLSQIMMLMRMLRLLRILRLVKLVKAVKPLYILVMGVSSAVQGVVWVLVLTLVTLYAMSIMSTRLIGHGLIFQGHEKPSEDCLAVFGTVPDSMFTLFRVMSGAQSEDESAKIDVLMTATPSMKFGFVFFLVTSSWTMLSVLTAVVSEKMIGTCNEEQAEMNMLSYEEDRTRHIEELQKLFTSLDTNHNGVLILKELEPVLNDPSMAAKIAHICRVPVRNVRDCFHTLSRNGGSCPLDFFIETMLEVAKPATELSVMKILAQILDAQHQVENTRSTHQGHMERLLEVVEGSQQGHHNNAVQMEERSAQQEAAYSKAILEMELKNAAQEQAHSEAVMELVKKNNQNINSVLESVNSLAVRQAGMEKKRIATENALTARMAGLALSSNGTYESVRSKIDRLISLNTCCEGGISKATDQESIDIGGNVDQHREACSREPVTVRCGPSCEGTN